MRRLEGKRIALVGQRKVEELSKLVSNLGGIPIIRPAQGTVFLDDSNLERDIQELIKGKYNWFIFTTGIGTELLYKTAVRMNIGDTFIKTIQEANVAARGYKTLNMLKRLSISPLVKDDDGTTAGLVRALKDHSLTGCNVALQLHGDPAPKLIDHLTEQEAYFKEILPYKHIPPQIEVMEKLLLEIINREIDAVNFTSTPQVRFLFAFAKEKGKVEEVLEAFSSEVIAVVVGKVTAAALKDEGINRMVIPKEERMGSAIIALEQYYKKENAIL